MPQPKIAPHPPTLRFGATSPPNPATPCPPNGSRMRRRGLPGRTIKPTGRARWKPSAGFMAKWRAKFHRAKPCASSSGIRRSKKSPPAISSAPVAIWKQIEFVVIQPTAVGCATPDDFCKEKSKVQSPKSKVGNGDRKFPFQRVGQGQSLAEGSQDSRNGVAPARQKIISCRMQHGDSTPHSALRTPQLCS